MLSKNEVIVRYVAGFILFFLPISEIITGWPAIISGVLGAIELAIALLKYSPLHCSKTSLHHKTEPAKGKFASKPKRT